MAKSIFGHNLRTRSFQACSFHRIQKIISAFILHQFRSFHHKTLPWIIFGHFYYTLSLAACKRSEKNNESIPINVLDWWMDEHTLIHTDPSRHDQGFKKQKINSDKPWTAQSLRHWHYLIKTLIVLDLLSNATQI